MRGHSIRWFNTLYMEALCDEQFAQAAPARAIIHDETLRVIVFQRTDNTLIVWSSGHARAICITLVMSGSGILRGIRACQFGSARQRIELNRAAFYATVIFVLQTWAEHAECAAASNASRRWFGCLICQHFRFSLASSGVFCRHLQDDRLTRRNPQQNFSNAPAHFTDGTLTIVNWRGNGD